MKKPHNIIQTIVKINPDTLDNHMILVFTENNQVISTHTIIFPYWWKFYDEKFPFHPFSYN
jgi:hypothetical protein